MVRSMTIPLPSGAVPPMGASPVPGPPGGGGGGADAVAANTGTSIRNEITSRLNNIFFISLIFSFFAIVLFRFRLLSDQDLAVVRTVFGDDLHHVVSGPVAYIDLVERG